jgi:hypothetical protein
MEAIKVRKNQVKLFFILLFTTSFIFSSSHFGALAFEKIKNDDNKATKNETLHANKSQFDSSNNKDLGAEISDEKIILNQSIMNINDIPIDLQTFLEHSSKIDISEQSTFSLLDFVKEKGLDKLNFDTLSLIASGIYQSILTTNFSILERNIGNSLPENDSLGFESELNIERNEDLIFSNPNNSVYSIELVLENKSLKITLLGEKLPYHYKITKDIQTFKPKTIIQYSPLLPNGKVKVATTGKDGKLVKVYRDVYQGEQKLKRELISSDFYPPVHRVEIHSLNTSITDQVSQTNTQTVSQENELTEQKPSDDNDSSRIAEQTPSN